MDGKLLHSGRGNLGELLEKLSETVGEAEDADAQPIEHHYDLLVLGGGPAGASAAIYSARKGLKVAVVAQRIGGQVKETTAIENLISVTRTTGETLASDLRKHMDAYGIDIFENRTYQSLSLEGKEKSVEVGSQRAPIGEDSTLTTKPNTSVTGCISARIATARSIKEKTWP